MPSTKKTRDIGTLRASQVITTYGPGSFVDLPEYSVIVAGLDAWQLSQESEIHEPRLSAKLMAMTGLSHPPQLHAPPSSERGFLYQRGVKPSYVAVRTFPKWFVDQEEDKEAPTSSGQTGRRLLERKKLGVRPPRDGPKRLVATRFVRACPKGHVADIDWRWFVHGDRQCPRQLWLIDSGTGGDLTDLTVRCECGESKKLGEAADRGLRSLGKCPGTRPWLGPHDREQCDLESRLLIRTATNAYFPQPVRVLSVPERESAVEEAVAEKWPLVQHIGTPEMLEGFSAHPGVAGLRREFADEDILDAIDRKKGGPSSSVNSKQLEANAFLDASEGHGRHAAMDGDFHACALPREQWRQSSVSSGDLDKVDRVVQVHRLREVSALVGFTRLDAVLPDIHGEYESEAERAPLAQDPDWFPAVENRGEGIFLALNPDEVRRWSNRPAVQERVCQLERGYKIYRERRTGRTPAFPGGPYILLHTLSHLLMHSISLECGYPATSIRERIYLTENAYGILLYTASPDAEGTLGGLVQQTRKIGSHLERALRTGALCSSDPVCAQHRPDDELEERWLHGAACHNCSLIAETSCEMRNEFLDRALVVPTLASPGAAFFTGMSSRE